MLKTAKRWALFTLAACILVFIVSAAIVYIVDPFEIYRESSILPLYDQESYNNPGIVKSYDYDAVILGTSMVEMSNPSVIDECFGVSSVKLPMRGSHTSHMGWQLSHAFKAQPDLKLAILAVDAYSLMGQPDDHNEIIDYLWNDNVIDDVNYLLNRDVLLVRVPKMLKNIGKPTDTKRDDMYKWTDVTFAAQSVFDTVTWSRPGGMMDPEHNISRSTENIERHLKSQILAHPDTTFLIYTPPYSVGYWYQVNRLGISEQQFRSRARICELLLDCPNVEIYDYASRIEWITQLDEYFDYSHHSEKISNMLMHAMANGENRITSVEQMWENSQIIREAVDAFAAEYEPLFLK